MNKFILVFDCPQHGEERGVVCFRGMSNEYRNNWKWYELVESSRPVTDKELFDSISRVAGISDMVLGE